MLARTANSSALRASLAAATPSSSLVAAAAPRFISSSTPRSANPEQSTDTIPTQRLRPRAAPLSPSAPPPSGKPYSHLTVSIVKGVAKLMGYNSRTSTAIRVTSDLYDRCAERAEAEADFWYGGEYERVNIPLGKIAVTMIRRCHACGDTDCMLSSVNRSAYTCVRQFR